MTEELRGLDSSHVVSASTCKSALEAVGLLRDATAALLKAQSTRPDAALAVSVPYLMLCGYVMGGWLMAKASAISASNLEGPEKSFYESKLHTARFYADQVLPNTLALARVVASGAESVLQTDAALV
jgi:butyryl-CoA dehydrogenase